MIKDTLITSSKTVGQGYGASYLGGWNPDGFITEKLMRQNMEELKSTLSAENFGIIESLAKGLANEVSGAEPICDSLFLPQGFEDAEARGLPDADFIEYVLYRYKYHVFPKLKILDDYPPCVQIELTSICNFRCVMCYQTDQSFSRKSQGHMGMMDLDLFKHVVDQLEGNVHAVTMASRGEPTLNPHVNEMLQYAGHKFLGLKMNTNASTLSEEMCHNILSSGLKTLVFSADATSKEVYEKIRVNGNFDEVCRNIQRFKEIRASQYPDSKLQTRVSGVYISKYGQSIESMIEFWKENVDDVSLVSYNPWERAYENRQNDIKTPCSELWRKMFIWHNGEVNPCDYDYKSTLFSELTPNVRKESVSAIWRSDQYKVLRRQHMGGKRALIEPCKRCISL